MSAPWRLNCIEITVSTEVLALLHVNIPRMRLVTATDTIKRSQVLVIIEAMDDGRTWTKYTTKYCKRLAYSLMLSLLQFFAHFKLHLLTKKMSWSIVNDAILGVGSCICDGVSDEMLILLLQMTRPRPSSLR